MNYKDTFNKGRSIALSYGERSHHIFKGRNFITPDIVAIRRINKLDVEISMGTGFSTPYLFGVTVAGRNDLNRCCDLEELSSILGTLT